MCDAVNNQPVLAGRFSGGPGSSDDHFIDTHPDVPTGKTCIGHAVKLGLGSKEYNHHHLGNLDHREGHGNMSKRSLDTICIQGRLGAEENSGPRQLPMLTKHHV